MSVLTPAEILIAARRLAGGGSRVVAYLVCTQVGIDAETYSLPYVAGWADDDIELIQKTAERVISVARSILERLPSAEPAIEPDGLRWRS